MLHLEDQDKKKNFWKIFMCWYLWWYDISDVFDHVALLIPSEG